MAKKSSRAAPIKIDSGRIFSITPEVLAALDSVQLTGLVNALLNKGFSITLPRCEEAIYPQLDSMIEGCLSLASDFREGQNRAYKRINPEIEEVSDTLVEVSEDSVRLFQSCRPIREGEEIPKYLLHPGEALPTYFIHEGTDPNQTRPAPLQEYGPEYSNWSQFREIPALNPALQDAETAKFFETIAEICVLIKRRGKLPKELSRFFSGINHETLAQLGAQKPSRRKTRRRRGRAS